MQEEAIDSFAISSVTFNPINANGSSATAHATHACQHQQLTCVKNYSRSNIEVSCYFTILTLLICHLVTLLFIFGKDISFLFFLSAQEKYPEFREITNIHETKSLHIGFKATINRCWKQRRDRLNYYDIVVQERVSSPSNTKRGSSSQAR